jgi:hypothetical protein
MFAKQSIENLDDANWQYRGRKVSSSPTWILENQAYGPVKMTLHTTSTSTNDGHSND